jgi:hypothetical protein
MTPTKKNKISPDLENSVRWFTDKLRSRQESKGDPDEIAQTEFDEALTYYSGKNKAKKQGEVFIPTLEQTRDITKEILDTESSKGKNKTKLMSNLFNTPGMYEFLQANPNAFERSPNDFTQSFAKFKAARAS